MTTVRGKMVTDLYANADPFVAGMRAADQAARKSGASISSSIDRINSKEMRNLTRSMLGGLGTIGLVDTGAKMALDLAKGFADGSIKSMADAAQAIGKTLIENLKSIPIAGTFLQIGEVIGNMAFGVDAANKSLKESADQMQRTQGDQ